MRPLTLIDIVVAGFTMMVGTLSLGTAWNIWQNRNGGMLTRALCWKLAAWGIWSIFIMVETLYQYRMDNPVSNGAQWMADSDRLILGIPQAYILLWVIPRAKKH